MKNILQFVIAFAILLFGMTMQSQALEKTLLWKITGKGLEKPSYLYGTIHVACEVTLKDAVLNALEETQQLCLELDMDDESLQARMMESVAMKGGTALNSLASPEDFKVLDAFFLERIGVSATMFNTMKPFVVSAMLYPLMMDCPMQSVEGELMRISREQAEAVIGLETVAEQMAVFDAIPYEVQMSELIKTAKGNMEADKQELQHMLAVYASEDIDAMLAFIKDSENTMMSEFENELLVNRNKNWIPMIAKITKEKPTFFGVGAAHLSGEYGVIQLLRKAGFTVEAVLN